MREQTHVSTLPPRPRPEVRDLGVSPRLPRADASLVRALNALYAHGNARVLTLCGQPWTLQWRHRGVPAAGSERMRFRWRLGVHAGWLALDLPLLSALLDERHTELLPRELRYVLLADALHPLADALEKALHLRFEWSPPPADAEAPAEPPAATLAERAAGFTLAGRDGVHGGHLLFDDDAALAALLAAAPPMPRALRTTAALDGLRIPLPFVVGHSQISVREIGSVCPGDIISIERWSSSGAGLLVSAELGGVTGRRLVGLAEGTRITLQPWKENDMNRDTPEAELAGHDDDAAALPLDRLDALEVTLRFEVGELSVSLGELKGLNPGHVFELGQALNRSAVRIVAHGNVLGKGYLVAVGDQLGVRVSEFAASEL